MKWLALAMIFAEALLVFHGQACADTEDAVSVTLRILGPAVVIDDVFVNEGEMATFTVSLSYPSAGTITVDYATADETALAGEDYTAASGTIAFLPGQTSHTLNVVTLEDSLDEANETFYVNLGNVTGPASLTDSQGLGTILNDDGIPSIVIDDVLVYEGETATFTVRLSNLSTETITVSYTTSEGTALAGEDYTVASGIVTFLPGQMSHTFNVVTLDDLLDEVNETFLVNLGNVTGLANLADSQGMGTILDNDPAIPGEGSPGGGAVVEGTACMPLFPLMLPSLRGYRRATLVGDEDGDARVGEGDTVRYHVTVWNEGPSLISNVCYLDVLDPHGHLVAGSLTCSRGEVQAGGLLGLESVSLTLMALEPGAVVEIYYDVRVAAALPEGGWAFVGQG
ncbi:MAG: hypothetical protein KAU10_07235, partial [Dehalococcoidia bacterium]|nr:hypothetical protein [Dehalococcoidia bacterium]